MIDFSTHKLSPPGGRPPTRCAGLPPMLAVVILLLLGLALAASIDTAPAALQHSAERMAAPEPESPDLALFRGLAAQVRSGHDYYAAAIEAQRKGNYPVRPFYTVRLPTLTWLIATLSPPGAQALMLLLVAATVKAWSGRVAEGASASRLQMTARLAVIVVGMAPATIGSGIWFSELWAGLLIALSLALYRPDRWWPSIAVALAALLIRELALPYLLAMGLLAALAGRRREAIGWGIAIAAFTVAFTLHAHAVTALTQAGDPVSQGWAGHGGWTLFVSSCLEMTLLTVLPTMVVAILLPLSFFGMAAWHSPVALRTFVTLCGYALLIAIFARPDNGYWVWMINPILALGLLFAPRALADLLRSLLGRAGSTPPGAKDDRRA